MTRRPRSGLEVDFLRKVMRDEGCQRKSRTTPPKRLRPKQKGETKEMRRAKVRTTQRDTEQKRRQTLVRPCYGVQRSEADPGSDAHEARKRRKTAFSIAADCLVDPTVHRRGKTGGLQSADSTRRELSGATSHKRLLEASQLPLDKRERAKENTLLRFRAVSLTSQHSSGEPNYRDLKSCLRMG